MKINSQHKTEQIIPQLSGKLFTFIRRIRVSYEKAGSCKSNFCKGYLWNIKDSGESSLTGSFKIIFETSVGQLIALDTS